jgi:hypothetical protein
MSIIDRSPLPKGENTLADRGPTLSVHPKRPGNARPMGVLGTPGAE